MKIKIPVYPVHPCKSKTSLSERNSRAIDFDGDSSMEQKKREGYFNG